MDFVNRGAGQLLHDALHILPARGLGKDGVELLDVHTYNECNNTLV